MHVHFGVICVRTVFSCIKDRPYLFWCQSFDPTSQAAALKASLKKEFDPEFFKAISGFMAPHLVADYGPAKITAMLRYGKQKLCTTYLPKEASENIQPLFQSNK